MAFNLVRRKEAAMARDEMHATQASNTGPAMFKIQATNEHMSMDPSVSQSVRAKGSTHEDVDR